MKRLWKPMLCMLLAVLMLSSCSGQPSTTEQFPEVTQALGPATATPVPTAPPSSDVTSETGSVSQPGIADAAPQSIFDTNPYDVALDEGYTEQDALNEENYIDPDLDDGSDLYVPTPTGTVYPYAGSTPIPLDPIDMPTPTPRPSLSFTYGTYSAASVGVSFEGPAGWLVDESQAQTFILREPEAQIKDGQQCIITITSQAVTSNYTQSDLETLVKDRLDVIGGGSDISSFKPSYTATRYMMGSLGVYANYTATTTDGVEIGGRIQYVCIDRTLYGLEILFPEGFREDFIDVFGEIRGSMKSMY